MFPKETTLVDNQFGQGHSAGVIKRQAPSAWRRAPSLTLCFRSASGQSLMDRQYSSLSGGELFERITAEGYTMSEAEVINYMRQICEGVKHMHERNIIHLGKQTHIVISFRRQEND